VSIGNEHLGWGNTRAEKLAIAAEFLGRPVPDVEAPDWRLWIEYTVPTFLVQGAGRVDGCSYWLRCRDSSTEITIASRPGLAPFADRDARQIEWDADETDPAAVWSLAWPILRAMGEVEPDWSWGAYHPYAVTLAGAPVDVAHGQGLRDAVNLWAEAMTLERWRVLAGEHDSQVFHFAGEGGSGAYRLTRKRKTWLVEVTT